jgi:hypothetical protein
LRRATEGVPDDSSQEWAFNKDGKSIGLGIWTRAGLGIGLQIGKQICIEVGL